MKWLQRTVLRSSDVVVACAPHLIDTSRRIVGQASLSAAVIPNGVDVNHFTPPPPEHRRRTGSPHFLHVSNFASKKRTHEIVEAFADAELPPPAHLTMVGDGPCLQRTRERALELGLEDRVTFPGRSEDVRPFFWDADAFVLASDSEGAPLVLLEAMACGVPFISTPWGAASDVTSGECGLTVPIGNREALAEAMTGLIRNPEERQRMASRARQLAEERYSIEVYIERHLEVLR